MYIIVGTFYALPGKLPELIAVLREERELRKNITGTDTIVLTPVGGKFSEATYRFQIESLSEYEEEVKKLEADPGWQALLKKGAALVVPNTSHMEIYRQV